MKRTPGWRRRLADALVIDAAVPHKWGTHDCFLGLVAPAVQAMTGEDIGAAWRGRYDTSAAATELLKEAGHSGLGDAVAASLPEIHPSQAHIGDIAVIQSQGGLGEGLGVVVGDRIQVLSERGMASVPLHRATRAFRV